MASPPPKIKNLMWPILLRVLKWLVAGAVWLLPFLSTFISAGVAGLGGLYLIFTWLYSVYSSNLQTIVSFFDSCIHSIDRLQEFVTYDNSSMIQSLMYACAIDSLFSDFSAFVAIVFSVVGFLVIGVISSMIGILVPLIVRKAIQSLASVASKTMLGGSST